MSPGEPTPTPARKPNRLADGIVLLTILILTAVFVTLRIRTNGILTDSVAAQDTESYFQCADRNFLTRSGYTCSRSAALPFLYSLLNPTRDHELTVLAEPFFGSAPRLAVQPGTEAIILFQLIFSIVSWVLFVWTAASLFENPSARVFAALILFAFAFVPQQSDWDSILLSESLSFSFFILMSAFFLWFLRFALSRPARNSRETVQTAAAAALTFLSAAGWIFTRDTNAYYVALIALLCFGLTAAKLRRRALRAAIVPGALTIALAVLFLFQQSAFRESERWLLPMMNNYVGNVFPYETRVAWFAERGMPVSETLLTRTGSAEYNGVAEEKEFIEWLRNDGTKTYTAFLVDHPLLTALSVYNAADEFFAENVQPFFYGAKEDKPRWAEPLGNLLHPLTSALLLIAPALCLILIGSRAAPGNPLWTVFACLLTAGGIALTGIAYLGEVRSIWRHVLSGVFMLRLATWIGLLAVYDRTRSARTEKKEKDDGPGGKQNSAII